MGGTILVGLVVLSIVGLAIRKLMKDKKSGNSCSGGCSNCKGGCH